MFGTLKPRSCGPAVDKALWQRFYCGLCQGNGEAHGQLYRVLHSHDAVLIALLADALQGEAAGPDRVRCPMMPLLHRDTASPQSPALRYAVAVQLLLADQWVADKAEEGGSLARWGRPVLSGGVERAWAEVAALGLDLSALRGFEGRQAAIERRSPGPREAATPTAEALALGFGAIAHLPGSVAGVSTEAMARLGSAVGAAIYLIDALDDLAADQAEGAFNPCLVGGAVVPERLREADRALTAALVEIKQTLTELPLQRHRSLVGAVLVEGLEAQAAAARKTLRAFAPAAAVFPPLTEKAAGVRILGAVVPEAQWQALSRVHRLVLAVYALAWSVWIATGSRVALAGKAASATELEKMGLNCGRHLKCRGYRSDDAPDGCCGGKDYAEYHLDDYLCSGADCVCDHIRGALSFTCLCLSTCIGQDVEPAAMLDEVTDSILAYPENVILPAGRGTCTYCCAGDVLKDVANAARDCPTFYGNCSDDPCSTFCDCAGCPECGVPRCH